MSDSKPARLPQLEMECLKVLWRHSRATVAEVRAELPRPLAYTTVMTVLDRMAAKGIVGRSKNGRAFVYAPVLDLETARASAVGQLLANFFEQDSRALIRYLSGEAPAAATPGVKRVRQPAVRRGPQYTSAPSQIDDSLL